MFPFKDNTCADFHWVNTKLFNKPVWILGHSNGGASAAEYLKWLEKEKKPIDIKGVVFASGANGTKFPSSTKIPGMFVHHEKDGCVPYITDVGSRGIYEKLKATVTPRQSIFWHRVEHQIRNIKIPAGEGITHISALSSKCLKRFMSF